MKRQQLIASIMEDIGLMKRLIHARVPKQEVNGMPTHAQMGILFLLAHEGARSLKDIAAHLHISPSAGTQLIDGLVADKLLTRTEDTQDRRKIVLALTEHGKQELERTKKIHCEGLTELFEPLSDAELVQWQVLQRKIVQHLK